MFSKLSNSIFSSDIYIFIFFIITSYEAFVVKKYKSTVENEIYDWEAASENVLHLSRNNRIFNSYNKLNTRYTLFITLISIFPLLGMFGTVRSLLVLDMSSVEAISSARHNFFDALTSTAWGIIFAVFFKLVNALLFADVEDLLQRHLALKKKLTKNSISESQKQTRH